MRSTAMLVAARALAILAAACPPMVIAVLVARYARNVPWWDQWGLVPFMAEATQGRFPPPLLWYEVNEHRIPAALLLQGGVAWLTRWDIRFDAWTNVALGIGSLLALAALARRTIAPLAPGAAAVVTAVCSLLVLSPVAGASWTAGWITPAFLAAFAAACTAWLVADSASWWRLTATLLTASIGALAFGSGMVLVLLVPLAVIARPGRVGPRVVQAVVASVVAFALIRVYFIGWYPRVGFPPPVFQVDRLGEYVAYTLAFVGGPVSERHVAVARVWGGVLVVALVAASLWLVRRRPDLRPALLPWWFLALFGIANGLVTSYGRLDNGAHTAVLVRYVPTAGLFVAAVVAVVTMAIVDVRGRSPRAGAVLLVGALLLGGWAGNSYGRVAWRGVADMARLALRLDRSTACVRSCSAACLTAVCWSGQVARDSCLLMERLGIGPFRDTQVAGAERARARSRQRRRAPGIAGARGGLHASASACLPS